MTRPRPVFRARSASTPPGFGCARLATLAFAPPHPGGVEAEGRKTNYRKTFTPPLMGAFLTTTLVSLFSSNLLAISYTVDGTVTFEVIRAPNESAPELNFPTNLPPELQSHREELVAAYKDALRGLSDKTERTFSLHVSNCTWTLSVFLPNATNHGITVETYDGDSILYFSVPQDTNSGVFRQPTNGTHRITLGAIAESGPVPRQCFGDGAECVWLAYASGCYFRGNSNLLGISLETLNTSLGDFKRFDVPIRHLDHSVSPYLPEAVDYTVTNFEYLGPDGAILERSLPKPFEHGYTRATFRTGTFTNLG